MTDARQHSKAPLIAATATERPPTVKYAAAPKEQVQAAPWTDFSEVRRARSKSRLWVAQGAIECGQTVILAGAEKRGKSTMLIDLAAAVAAGGKWLERFQCRPAKAVYLDAENGPARFAHMLESICRARRYDQGLVEQRIRHLHSTLTLSEGDEQLAEVVDALEQDPATVVILDPLGQHLTGSEVDTTAVRDALLQADRLRTQPLTTLVIAHHLSGSGHIAGNRSIRTMADLIITGTDEERPWFNAYGRTLRDRDPIASKFTVDLRDLHDDDRDDTKRELHLAARFESDPKPAGHKLSTNATKALTALGKIEPATQTQVRNLASLNSKATSAALKELLHAGKVKLQGKLWSTATSAYLTGLGAS